MDMGTALAPDVPGPNRPPDLRELDIADISPAPVEPPADQRFPQRPGWSDEHESLPKSQKVPAGYCSE
jgi:hypothetical protein